MQLPCDAILEEPERFHGKKQKYNNNPKQEATDHKFAYNNSNTENSKVQFQRLTLVKVDEWKIETQHHHNLKIESLQKRLQMI